MIHYLNNAGAALMSTATVAVMEEHLKRETSIGGYVAASEKRDLLSEFYGSAARALGILDASSIAFMDSASRAWNMALYGMPIRLDEIIITLSSEFGTNLVSLFHFANKIGAKVHVVACDEEGNFDLHEIELFLRKGARLIAISHAAAHGSIVNPVAEIGKLAKRYEAMYLVDGCQAVGQITVDVESIGCTAYTATGRKWLRGPRGTGFLYVRPESPISTPYVDLASADLVLKSDHGHINVRVREDARKFELWERSIAAQLGLGNALREFLDLDVASASQQMISHSQKIREAVKENPHLALLGRVSSNSAIAGFYLRDPGREEELKSYFLQAGISISTMSDWDCPLHFPNNGSKSIFRLSPHYYTPIESVELAISLIASFQ